MNVHTGEYAKLLQERWLKAGCGECLSAFFTVHDREMFSVFLDRVLPSLTTPENILRLKYSDRLSGPFAPFLDWTARKVWAENHSPSEFLDSAGVYIPLRPVFFSYLNQGYATRDEEVITEELAWEIRCMRDAIWKTFRKMRGNSPLLIVIEEMTRLPIATLKAIRDLFSSPDSFPALFIFSCDDRYPDPDEKRIALCREVMRAARSRTLNINAAKKYTPQTRIHSETIEDTLESGRDCLHFLALEDAREILIRCRQKMLDSGNSFQPEREMELLTLLGDTHRLLGEYDEALLCFQNLLTLAREKKNSAIMASAYRRIGMSQLLRENTDRAKLMATKGLQLAGEIEDLKLIFENMLVLFLAEDKLRQMDIETWRLMNSDLLEKCGQLGWENTRAFILTNQYGTFSKYSAEYRLQHEEGLRISKQIGNIYRLASGLHTKGLIASVQGNRNDIIKYYKKSEEIKEKLGNDLEMAYIKNGLGFYSLIMGSYGEALENFNSALTLLNRVREFHEIAMTWFNMASANFLSFNHDRAIELLESILSLLSVMETENLAYHSRFGIYAFLGTVYACHGDTDRAYEYLTRIKVESLKPYPEKNEEYFFYFLLRAMLAEHENRISRAEKLFRRSELYLLRTNDVITYLEPRFRLEFSGFYKRNRMASQAAGQLSFGKKAARQLQGTYYKKMYSRKTFSSPATDPDTTPFKLPDFPRVLEMCRTEQQMTRLHNRINEISFLNSFQLATVREELDESRTLETAANLIKNAFPVDAMFIHKFQDGIWTEVHRFPEKNETDYTVSGDTISLLADQDRRLFRAGMKEIPAITGLCRASGAIVSLPITINDNLQYHLLCRNDADSKTIERESLRVLSIAASQLGNALSRIHKDRELQQANKKLKEMATSDVLTGLSNRTALHRRLSEESHRIRRYTSDDSQCFTMVFLDLDNFKYYNDTFGHLVGDRLLILFANIIKLICRDVDFIARYGGDEFILILPETDAAGATLLIERLYDEIRSQRNFKTALEGILGKTVEIPEDRKLSFSSGIATYNASYENDIEKLLKDADRALYLAKEAGKNTFKVYQ